jgi:hypothetical protein
MVQSIIVSRGPPSSFREGPSASGGLANGSDPTSSGAHLFSFVQNSWEHITSHIERKIGFLSDYVYAEVHAVEGHRLRIASQSGEEAELLLKFGSQVIEQCEADSVSHGEMECSQDATSRLESWGY